MRILYSTIHNLDIERRKIDLRKKENDFDEALSSILLRINMQENLKKYEENSVNTCVVKSVLDICDHFNKATLEEELFKQLSNEIAQKLLDVEVAIQDRNNKTHGGQLQKGSIIQAIAFNQGTTSLEYYIAKLEHVEFYTNNNFLKMIGFQIDKAIVYKSCKFKINSIDDFSSIEYAEVHVNNNAKYWTDKFLELREINDDAVNTRKAFNSIDGLLNKHLRSSYRSDYQIIRNAFVTYFRTGVRMINYHNMIEDIFDGYEKCLITDEKVEQLKEALLKLPTQNSFDTQFIVQPTAIKGRKYTSYKVNSGIELILNKTEGIQDLPHTIIATEEKGVKYLKIITNDIVTFETFKRNKK